MGGYRFEKFKKMNKKVIGVFATKISDPSLRALTDESLANKLRDTLHALNCALSECEYRGIQVNITREKNQAHFHDEYSAHIYRENTL